MVNTNTTAPRHPPVVDLADFAARKEEITADLMKAATTIGARPEGPGTNAPAGWTRNREC